MTLNVEIIFHTRQEFIHLYINLYLVNPTRYFNSPQPQLLVFSPKQREVFCMFWNAMLTIDASEFPPMATYTGRNPKTLPDDHEVHYI